MNCTVIYWNHPLKVWEFLSFQRCTKKKCTVLYITGKFLFSMENCSYFNGVQILKCSVLYVTVAPPLTTEFCYYYNCVQNWHVLFCVIGTSPHIRELLLFQSSRNMKCTVLYITRVLPVRVWNFCYFNNVIDIDLYCTVPCVSEAFPLREENWCFIKGVKKVKYTVISVSLSFTLKIDFAVISKVYINWNVLYCMLLHPFFLYRELLLFKWCTNSEIYCNVRGAFPLIVQNWCYFDSVRKLKCTLLYVTADIPL
jgi:hypothetical protein